MYLPPRCRTPTSLLSWKLFKSKTKLLKNKNQRKRWASKGLFYKNKSLVLKLIFIFLFYISLIIQPVLGMFYNSVFYYSFLLSVFAKIIFEFAVMKKGTEILFDKNILNIFMLAEFLHVPYIIISGLMGLFGNYKWKGRELER